MDMPEVKSFNAELSGLYDNKPPISKAKMSAITKGAIKAIKFYKHVVHSVEKFIQKCKPEYKVPGLYVIDSIVRQSRHQFGQDKDVFAPRFAKNMQQTFANLFRCPPEDKRNIIRVLNLWQKNNVFSSQVIQPLLDMADPNHPLHQEIQQQQNNTANGSSLNVSHNTTDNKMSPTQHSPHASSPMGGDQFQDEPEPPPKFNRKLLNDFEYDSEDDAAPEPAHAQHSAQNTTDALGSILTNPEIMRQLQSLQAQMQMMTGMQIPNLMPMMSDLQMQQNQNQSLPFMSSQQDSQNKSENNKDDMGNNESDIEFVETGPQVIEIPDANDSSPSPKSRRHRSRSKSPRRRRRSRSRSRSPRRRRDRERERDRDREREREKERERGEKDREKTFKDREVEKEKQREREKKGLPPIKRENLSVCSTTLWVGHLSKLATPEELSDLFGALGGVASIDVVAPRGCAFVVMERRRDAHKALAKLNRHKLYSKEITVAWAPGKGVKGRDWKDYWEAELGVSYLPWAQLQQRWALGALSLDALEDGGAVDEDTLPPWLPPRILPKSMMENMSMLGMSAPGPGLMPNMPGGNLPSLPANLPPGNLPLPPASMSGGLPPVSLAPNLTTLAGASLSLPPNIPAPSSGMPMQVTRMPPPGMTAGMPPGMAPGMPPGIRPPSIPGGVPGLPPGGPLLRFPPGLPPQSMAQSSMVGGFLSGLLGVGVGVGGLVGGVGLLHAPPLHATPPPAASVPALSVANIPPPQQRTGEVSHSDDAMDLDTEDHNEEANGDVTDNAPPALLPDQIQALLSKPPPNFNASEPPPGFNMSEPPPFNVNQPPPSDDKQDDERKDRDRDRRDRDRDRRDRDRGDRRDRDRRDRDRGRDRDSRGERDERRDRDRDRGRDRRDRDRDRDRERDRFNNRPGENNRERSREKSPLRANVNDNPEKSLQERLWEMANGKPRDDKREDFESHEPERDVRELRDARDVREVRAPLIDRLPVPPHAAEPGEGEAPPAGDSWRPPPHPAPLFRPELRMRGPPRPPMQGPWMDGPGPGPFGPRFNGMGPPFNRPPFDGPRPPFDGAPLFEGGPRFERPPFGRMPFDAMNRPPFDGPRPPFDGPRPPFEGPRPPFDGPRPPFDAPRPFDGPPFDGDRPPFDGPPRFDGPPEFYDRGRRFDDREQFPDRGWGGGDRDRGDREWGDRERRPDWDDRRRDRRPGAREHEDRFNRDRNDRRRTYDDNNRSRRPSDNPRQPDTARQTEPPKQLDTPKQADVPKPTEPSKPAEAPKLADVPKPADAPKDEKNSRRERDRKSRWGAAEESAETSESSEPTPVDSDSTKEYTTQNESSGDSAALNEAKSPERAEYIKATTHHEQNVQIKFSEPSVSQTCEQRETTHEKSYNEPEVAEPMDVTIHREERHEISQENVEQTLFDLAAQGHEEAGADHGAGLYDACDNVDTSFSRPPHDLHVPHVEHVAHETPVAKEPHVAHESHVAHEPHVANEPQVAHESHVAHEPHASPTSQAQEEDSAAPREAAGARDMFSAESEPSPPPESEDIKEGV